MSKIYETISAIIASFAALSLKSYYIEKGYDVWYINYLAPIITLISIVIILFGIKSLFLYLRRPLKKYEGYWIESIDESKVNLDKDLITIMKLYYKDGDYWVKGESYYLKEANCLATWKSEKAYIYDLDHFELDYIYKADLIEGSKTTRGYAKVKLGNNSGFIVDIDRNEIKKDEFLITKIKNEKDVNKFTIKGNHLDDKIISSFKKFIKAHK